MEKISTHHMRTLHLAVSILGLIAFALSGFYMHHFLKHLKFTPDGPRLLYRTAHIHLLWASLINLLLGAYLYASKDKRKRQLQLAASCMLILTPFLIGLSFLNESNSQALFRPFARDGIYLALIGCLIHAFVSLADRKTQEP